MLPEKHPLSSAQAMLMFLFSDVPEDWLVEFWAIMPEDYSEGKKTGRKRPPPQGMKERYMEVTPIVALEKSFEGALGNWVTDHNQKGYEIYYGVAPRFRMDRYANGHYMPGKKEHVSSVPCLWLDIDHPEWQKVLNIHNIRGTFVISSGHGCHVYLKTAAPVAAEQAEREMKHLIKKYVGSDHTFDCRRLLRLPGTRNWKDLTKELRCEVWSSDIDYVFEGVNPRELNVSEPEKKVDMSSLSIEEKVRKIQNLELQNTIWFGYKHAGIYSKNAITPEGELDRSEVDFRVTKDLLRANFSFDDYCAIFKNSAFGISEKALKTEAQKGNLDHYLDQNWKNARLQVEIESTRGQEVYGDVLPYETADDLSKATMVTFAIEDLLPVGGMMIVSGPGKAGKSMMVEDLILLLAGANGKFLEHFNVGITGSVFYLQSELNKSSLRSRLERMSISRGGDYCKLQHDLFFFHKRLNLGEPNHVVSLTNTVRKVGAKYLVIDPLARFHFLNENKQGDMAKVLSTIEKVAQDAGCIASIIVHHHGKPQEGQEREGLQAIRGASVIGDWGNAHMIIKRRKDEILDQKFVEISFELRDSDEPNGGKPFKMIRDKMSLRFFPYSEEASEEGEVQKVYVEAKHLPEKELIQFIHDRLRISKAKAGRHVANIRIKERLGISVDKPVDKPVPVPTNGNGNAADHDKAPVVAVEEDLGGDYDESDDDEN